MIGYSIAHHLKIVPIFFNADIVSIGVNCRHCCRSTSGTVIKGSTYDITEEYTGIVYTRVRGRQLIFKMASNQINTTWQLGAPRIDIRPDGRR